MNQRPDTGAGSPPESFGRYQLRERLGGGGFAEVFRAHDPELEREVALKVILANFALDQEFVQRFLQEMRLAAGLTHPNIIPIHDVGRSSSGRPFCTMSLLDDDDLRAILQRRGPLDLAEAIRILKPLAAALDYLADMGLVHRDVKPANVVLSRTGEPILVDFGIARSAAATVHMTQTGVLIGTPQYMAPEQVRGSAVGPAADRYALGLLAYELLSGRAAYTGDTAQVLYAQVNEPPPPLVGVRPNMRPSVYRAVARALEKDPNKRPATAAAFVEALAGEETAISGSQPLEDADTELLHESRFSTVRENRNPTPTPVPEPNPRRNSIPFLLAGVVAVVAVVLMVAVVLIGVAIARHSSAGSQTPAASLGPSVSGGGDPTPSGTLSTGIATVSSSASAATPPRSAATPRPVATVVPPANPANLPAQQSSVIVVEPYGAALRSQPSSDATIQTVAACGQTFPVVAVGDGWFQVQAGARALWVGGARVAETKTSPRYDCTGATTFQMNQQVVTSVATGCLSLRDTPSRTGTYVHCVDNGYRYSVINGPMSVDGEDWIEVTSPGTGSGWVLAQYLSPAR